MSKVSKSVAAVSPVATKQNFATDGFEAVSSGNSEQGELRIVRASKLAEEGITGIVAEGTLESAKPNKFNPDKNDYYIRGADNTLYIVNGTSTLQTQMDELKGLEGTAKVRIVYNGMGTTKKGKPFHNFDVLVAR